MRKQGQRVRATDSRGRPVRGIYLRDGRYIAGFESAGRWRMVTLEARTLTEARRERESLLAGLREGRTAVPATLAVRDLFADYMQTRTLSARTDAHERDLFGRYLGTIAARRAQDVTASDIAAVMRDLRERGLSSWTRVAVYRIVRGTFAHGVRRGVLSRTPTDGLAPSERPPQRNARAVEVLTAEEIAKLVRAASSERWRAALGLAGFAGLRLGEIRALRWADIDLAAGAISINASMGRNAIAGPPKTEAGRRVVPIVPALRRLLAAWRLRSPHTRPHDLVVCTAEGDPVQERNIRRALDAAKGTAGLDATEGRLSMHSLRHSWASALATGGLAATTLARLTGHADAGFTLRVYAADPRDDAAVTEGVLTLAAKAGFGG
jgi:integrase